MDIIEEGKRCSINNLNEQTNCPDNCYSDDGDCPSFCDIEWGS